MSLKPKFVNRFMHKFTNHERNSQRFFFNVFKLLPKAFTSTYYKSSPPALLETNKASTQISLSFSVADAADATVVVINVVVVVRMK